MAAVGARVEKKPVQGRFSGVVFRLSKKIIFTGENARVSKN